MKNLLYSIEAERSIVGILLNEINWIDDIANIISVNDFFEEDCRCLYATLQSLFIQNKYNNVLDVFEYLRKQDDNKYKKIANLDMLSNLAISVNRNNINLIDYAKTVKKFAEMRNIINTLNNSINEIYKTPSVDFEVNNHLDKLESALFKIRNNNNGGKDFTHVVEATKDVINDLETISIHKQNDTTCEILTGFTELDKKTNGLHGGDLIIIAGRPAMGKTAFAMNIVENIAIRNAKKQHRKMGIGIFSLEMTIKQLALRMISSLASVKSNDLATGNLTDIDMVNIAETFNKFSDSYIYIDDSGYLTPQAIRSKTKRLAQKLKNNENGDDVKLDLIVIDYLQLIAADKNMMGKPAFFDKKELIPEITRSLKLLAKDLDIPIILLSQLNRENEKRTDKRPMLSDLRDSGAIEQDADMVIMMFREEYYNKGNPALKGKAEAIITKYRNGDTGTVKLVYEGDFTRFVNMNEYGTDPNDYSYF